MRGPQTVVSWQVSGWGASWRKGSGARAWRRLGSACLRDNRREQESTRGVQEHRLRALARSRVPLAPLLGPEPPEAPAEWAGSPGWKEVVGLVLGAARELGGGKARSLRAEDGRKSPESKSGPENEPWDGK